MCYFMISYIIICGLKLIINYIKINYTQVHIFNTIK